MYLRADGIHVNIRLEEHKLCLLVMIGVRADGRKKGQRTCPISLTRSTAEYRAIEYHLSSPVGLG